MSIQVGVDTGGTFTDLVVVAEGRSSVVKVPSTPPDFERGVLEALRQAGVEPSEIALLAHGTTATTNALLTKSGAKTLLITTRGFRDVLELRRHDRGDLYDIMWEPPPPLVRRRDRLEVAERADDTGAVLEPLDEEEATRVARIARRREAEAVAVVFLHSYANPAAEQRMKEILRFECPEAYVSVSSDLMRESDEFERTSTTTANAYLGPIFQRYIRKLGVGLADVGYSEGLFVMHSGGGLLPAASMARVPVRTVTSGPAAGALAAAAIARDCDRLNLISLDMGGTSADIATIGGGAIQLDREYNPEFGLTIRFPSIDLLTIGAGGGSVIWIDQAGYPQVGPDSAGARPGPACYGFGGTDPTLSDANSVLGRLPADRELAGGLRLDERAARDALSPVAASLGLALEVAAAGAIDIANSNMAKAIRVMTIERGLDPREFSLLAFGGAGPLHAVELARELDIPEVIVPPHPGLTSAFGLLFADVVHDLALSLVRSEDQLDFSELADEFRALEERATADLERDGFVGEKQRCLRFLDLRFTGQIKSLTMPLDAALDDRAWGELRSGFFEEYERRFHHVARELPLEVAALRVKGIGHVPRPTGGLMSRADGAVPSAYSRKRDVYFAGAWVSTNVVARDSLPAGERLVGPLVIEELDSTTLVPPGCELRVDPQENLLITTGTNG